MEPNIKVNGDKTVHGASENLHIKMETIIKVNGFTIKQTELENTIVKMVANTKGDGEEIYNMERDGKYGRTEVIMKDSLNRE